MDEKLRERVEKMPLKEKVGQLFLLKFYANVMEFPSIAPGGYLLEEEAFKIKKSSFGLLMRQLTHSEIFPFLAVDEEGGKNCSISSSKYFRRRRFRSVKELKNLTEVMIDNSEKLKLMKSIGINMNFGISANHATTRKAYCYPGSYSKSIDEVADYVDLVTELHKEFQVIPVIKDFPGYEDSKSIDGIVIDQRDYLSILTTLKPFITAIKRGAPAILIADSVIARAEYTPACLKDKIYDLLREKMKFDGVIISDSTNTGVKYDDIVQQITLGTDLVITNLDVYESQMELLIKAVNEGSLKINRVDEAVMHVLKLKEMYKLM